MSHSVARLSVQQEMQLKCGLKRVLRPVAFRHPISRILVFSWIDKNNDNYTFVCKNHTNFIGIKY